MPTVDLKRTFVMVSGLGIGMTVGFTLFSELYAAIALGVVGLGRQPVHRHVVESADGGIGEKGLTDRQRAYPPSNPGCQTRTS